MGERLDPLKSLYPYTDNKFQGQVAKYRLTPYISGMPRLAIKPSRAVADLLAARRKKLGLTLREVEKKTGETGRVMISQAGVTGWRSSTLFTVRFTLWNPPRSSVR